MSESMVDLLNACDQSHAERNSGWEIHKIFYISLTSPEPRTNTSFIDYNLVVCTTKHYNLCVMLNRID